MQKHPRTIAGVALSTSALLLLGMPAAAEEEPAQAPPAADDCVAEPGGTAEASDDEPAPEPEPEPDADDDADGVPDVEDADADGDGEADVEEDTDGDGQPDGDDAAEEDPATDDDAADGTEPEDGTEEGAEADGAGESADGAEPAAGCAPVDAPAPPPAEVPAPPPAAEAPPAPAVDPVPPPPAEEAVDPVPPALDEVPADVLAAIAAYPRTPAGSTAPIVEALRPLTVAGLDAEEIAEVGFGRFPVGGDATWIHDWLFPRYVPTFHTHQGIDIFADRGTPVRAPAAGTVRVSHGSVGGLAVKVVEADGTYWYLAHLDAVVAGIDGTTVDAGAVVGTVGDSGNAKGGSPHVHLQLHPQGGDPVDPKPVIDQLAAEALANVPTVLAEHSGPSVVFGGFTWEPAAAVEAREPERDPILDLLLPLARLQDSGEHGSDNESEDGPEDE